MQERPALARVGHSVLRGTSTTPLLRYPTPPTAEQDRSAEVFHERVERCTAGAELLVLHVHEGGIDRAFDIVHVRGLRCEIEQACRYFAFALASANVRIRTVTIGRIVILIDLAQADHAAIMHHYVSGTARCVTRLDLAAQRDEIRCYDFLDVIARVLVALGRAFVIVERHAGRDHIDESKAPVRESRLQDRYELLFIAGKTARHERCTEREREQHRIDGLVAIRFAALRLRAYIRRCGELTFR